MRTLVLCGGKGTRAYPHTVEVPKPLLQVAGQPVLRHVLDIYAGQGWTEFVLAAGFQRLLIEEFATHLPSSWDVQVVDTGEDAGTGERVAKCRHLLGDTFFLTYGDGLGDVDLSELAGYHRSHAGSATLTTVPLRSQYGTLEWDGSGRVTRFREKPELRDHWINAGFFVVDQRAFEHWNGDDLEREVLPALSSAGELFVHRHDGFWRSMDTYKDSLELSALCGDGRVPWQRRPSLP
jgi:glucose-1-phosphate cytidylyltransferase